MRRHDLCFLSVGEGGRASRSTRKRFRSVKKIDQAAAGMRPMSDHWKRKHREHEGSKSDQSQVEGIILDQSQRAGLTVYEPPNLTSSRR